MEIEKCFCLTSYYKFQKLVQKSRILVRKLLLFVLSSLILGQSFLKPWKTISSPASRNMKIDFADNIIHLQDVVILISFLQINIIPSCISKIIAYKIPGSRDQIEETSIIKSGHSTCPWLSYWLIEWTRNQCLQKIVHVIRYRIVYYINHSYF